MDDPGLSWPAWKFGLKRADLFTSLHDQYNTFTFTLQDPEAFHADVSQISHDAQTTEEFHRMMADRRQQRLLELNESLESLAYEIIGNPKLMDSEHWTFALQLFRTKSFDSLVRYFASYIPSGVHGGKEARSNHSSDSEASTVSSTSTNASSVDDTNPSDVFCTGPVMTEEPSHLDSAQYTQLGVDAPLSPPESESDAMTAASADDDEAILCCDSTYARSRSMSFSGSESCLLDFSRPILHHDDEDHDHTSQSGSVNTAPTSVSDGEEVRSSIDSVDGKELHYSHFEDEEDDELLTAQFPEDAFDVYDAEQYISEDAPTESDTPTPRQDGVSTNSYIDYKSLLSRRLPSPHRQTRRSPSPSSRAHRDVGIPYEVRRSPDEAYSKIQKPVSDSTRRRVKGRT
ncbi:uncharacterized protein J7T54_008417 [Emericellopsis cladophorae]|uniref:Uncharacterized protein n=1 Tax=Emericellopsis cladophorae TaxID=2686198 RepID=A0A9Q0BEX4_9HYPO|nr:uncharacterized protein J7T54_008417 [Emericellopsis cladophorae]KAI6782331.1 hypothetical protein J7T54_008417 [Emericellopsis cladophorae]